VNTPIKPIGHRIVVQPDAPVTETASGFVIPDAYADTPPMSGIVLRVGDGPARDKHIRARAIARCLAILNDATVEAASPLEALRITQDEIARYLRDASELGPVCEVGQRVIFPMEAGHEIVLNEATDESVVILSEDSVLAVYDAEPQEQAA